MSFAHKISVIVPVHAQDTYTPPTILSQFEVIQSHASGRGAAMNEGVSKSKGDYFWFVHADSQIEERHVSALLESIEANPKSIHYFDLAFDRDGPSGVRINAWGANMRSRWFGLPWGDQALCMHRDVFTQIGPYDETAPYGEDHLLIWASKRAHVPLARIATPLITSAVYYDRHGWVKGSWKRQMAWLKQAWQEWRRHA